MPAIKDLMLSSRTDAELQRFYTGACATAVELGVKFKRSNSFANREELLAACEQLHARIEKFREGVDAKDEIVQAQSGSAGPGLNRLRQSPKSEAIRQATLSDQRRASARAMEEQQMSLLLEDASPATSGGEEHHAPRGGGGVKKKAKKKVAKKKVAKKAKAAKKPKGEPRERAHFDEGAKIHWLGKDNPRREGSGAFERMEKVRKSNGKTVKTYLAGGGLVATLSNAVKLGAVKVT